MKLSRPPMVGLAPGLGPVGDWDTVEIKYDGHWSQVVVEEGRVKGYSRPGALQFDRPLKMPFRDMWRARTVLHGEGIWGTHRSGTHPLQGKVVVFDCEMFGNEDLRSKPLSHRRQVMRGAVDLINQALGENLLCVIEVRPVGEWRKIWQQHVEADGGEGVIFKHSGSPWGAPWGRMKAEVTCDYVVVDVVEGGGKHEGRMGALALALMTDSGLLTVAQVGGGFSDADREWWWAQRKIAPGTVVEVKGWQLFPSGALRHPQFVRIRSDKTPDECRIPRLDGNAAEGGATCA